ISAPVGSSLHPAAKPVLAKQTRLACSRPQASFWQNKPESAISAAVGFSLHPAARPVLAEQTRSASARLQAWLRDNEPNPQTPAISTAAGFSLRDPRDRPRHRGNEGGARIGQRGAVRRVEVALEEEAGEREAGGEILGRRRRGLLLLTQEGGQRQQAVAPRRAGAARHRATRH